MTSGRPAIFWAASAGSRLARAAPLALATALALDVGLSAAFGYTVRMEPVLLVLLDLLGLVLLVTPTVVLLQLIPRPGGAEPWGARAVRASVLAAAVSPVALRLTHHLVVLIALLLICEVAARAERRLASPPPGLRGTVGWLAVCAILITVAVRLPLPGRELLTPPRATSGVTPTPEAPNLLLIVLDTTRADHFGLYGYKRPTTPFLDQLATRSTVFDEAISSSSWTLPAHATLFTGLYPAQHGADLAEGSAAGMSSAEIVKRLAVNSAVQFAIRSEYFPIMPLDPAAVTLAKLARNAGLETGAVCANSGWLNRSSGLDQGFETYVDAEGISLRWPLLGLSLASYAFGQGDNWWFTRLLQGNHRRFLRAEEVNALVREWVEPRRDRRFFLFVNYMDTHFPYTVEGSHASLFPASKVLPLQSFTYYTQQVESGRRDLTREERAGLTDAYDAQLRNLDDHLAELWRQLDAWHLLDRTAVVIVGDHGEAIGEHSEVFHQNGVYQTVLHVPLLVHRPGQTTPEREHRFVHLVDVFPTALELLGIPSPPGLPSGGLFQLDRAVPAVAFMGRWGELAIFPRYNRKQWAIYTDPWKLILRSDGDLELYDVRRDPREEHDLKTERPDIVAELHRSLDAFQASMKPAFPSGHPIVSPEMSKRLRAIGYIR